MGEQPLTYQLQPVACSEITALVQVALGTYRQFDGGERHASIQGRPNIDTIIMLSSFLSSSSCCWTHGLLPALPFLFCVCLTTYGCSVCSAGPFSLLVTRSAASSRQPDNGDKVPSLLLSFLRLARGKVFSLFYFGSWHGGRAPLGINAQFWLSGSRTTTTIYISREDFGCSGNWSVG